MPALIVTFCGFQASWFEKDPEALSVLSRRVSGQLAKSAGGRMGEESWPGPWLCLPLPRRWEVQLEMGDGGEVEVEEEKGEWHRSVLSTGGDQASLCQQLRPPPTRTGSC